VTVFEQSEGGLAVDIGGEPLLSVLLLEGLLPVDRGQFDDAGREQTRAEAAVLQQALAARALSLYDVCAAAVRQAAARPGADALARTLAAGLDRQKVLDDPGTMYDAVGRKALALLDTW
jgi:hypothetical protein